MCSCNYPPPETHPWRDALNAFVWRHRDDIRGILAIAVGLAAIAGALVYRFSPTDIERAEADLVKAREIVCALDRESDAQQVESVKHNKRASEHRRIADENKD